VLSTSNSGSCTKADRTPQRCIPTNEILPSLEAPHGGIQRSKFVTDNGIATKIEDIATQSSLDSIKDHYMRQIMADKNTMLLDSGESAERSWIHWSNVDTCTTIWKGSLEITKNPISGAHTVLRVEPAK
jgi:hypothetical protein